MLLDKKKKNIDNEFYRSENPKPNFLGIWDVQKLNYVTTCSLSR